MESWIDGYCISEPHRWQYTGLRDDRPNLLRYVIMLRILHPILRTEIQGKAGNLTA